MKLKKGRYIFSGNLERNDFIQDFPFLTNGAMAKKYFCSRRTIIRFARKMELQKDELFRQQFNFRTFGSWGAMPPESKATRFKPGIRISVSTEFKKDHSIMKSYTPGALLMKNYLKQIPAH